MGQHPRVIAFANQKGGTGKTTTVVNVAAALGLMRQRVLVIDFDGQGTATESLGLERDGRGLLSALVTGGTFQPHVRDSVARGVQVVPSGLPVHATDVQLARRGAVDPNYRNLDRCLQATEAKWDWILVDCPPALGLQTLNALTAATHFLVPMEPAPASFRGLRDLYHTIRDVRERYNPRLQLAGMVLCRVNPRRKITEETLDALNKAVRGKVAPTMIRENVALTECVGHGLPVLKYAPRSPGAMEYIAIAKWLRKEVG